MAKRLEKIRKVGEKIKYFIKKDVTTKSLIFIGLFLAILSILLISTAPERYDIEVGDIAVEDIFAPSDLVDQTATEIKVKAAEEAVQAIYKLDRTVQIDIQKKIENFFYLLTEIKLKIELDQNQMFQLIAEQSNIGLDNEDYKTLIKADVLDLSKLKDKILYINNQLLNENIEEGKINDKREVIK